MRNLMPWLLVACLLAPTFALAQSDEREPPTIPAESIGDGWALQVAEVLGDNIARRFSFWTVYGGPEGARVTIDARPILDSVRSAWSVFGDAYRAWELSASDVNEDDNGIPIMSGTAPDGLPESVTDLLRTEGEMIGSGLPVGVSLYASLELRVVVIVSTEGTVNGMTGVAATDYIAGLYFAALSDQ